SPDGDVIDCILRHQQPGLDHPLLRNHKIQDSPIRPSGIQGRYFFLLFVSVVQHATAYVKGGEYYGAKACMNVWKPHIETPGEFSLSQMWVLSGSFDGSDLNSIEAGWQSDSYGETGCYNLMCSGFIQTNKKIALGAAINPVSSFNGPQYDHHHTRLEAYLTLTNISDSKSITSTATIYKAKHASIITLVAQNASMDPKEGNWWMEFGDGTLVGYWPSNLFTHLSHHATMVEWGGEVVNTQQDGDHTSTQMGSGHFANEGFTKASYFRNLQVEDEYNNLQAIDSLSTLAEDMVQLLQHSELCQC
ncbi:hypothetical protein KI387_043641, partial [Taxus chinensis]